MELNELEKKEVGTYVFAIGRYIETYNEVYDHVLNALAEQSGPFHIGLVKQIIEDDFGGMAAIKQHENVYQKQLKRKYLKLIGLEMLYTFKLPNIIPNLILVLLCYVLYTSHANLSYVFKTTYLSILVLIVIVCLYWIVYRYIIHKKTKKDSIRGELTFGLLFLPIGFINIFANTIFAKSNIGAISSNAQQLTILAIFFFSSIYIRSFIKLYTEKIKVITI